MRKILAALILSLIPSLVNAQSTRITSSGTLPMTCVIGNVYLKTGTAAGFYYCLSTNTWTGPITGPGGSNTQVQFNDSGAFGGDGDFTWNKTSNLALFTTGSGLSFAGLVSPTIVTGGSLNSNSAIIFNNVVDAYVRLSFPQYSDMAFPNGLALVTASNYSDQYISIGGGQGPSIISATSSILLQAPQTDITSALINLNSKEVNNFSSQTSIPAATFKRQFTVNTAYDFAGTDTQGINSLETINTIGAVTASSGGVTALVSSQEVKGATSSGVDHLSVATYIQRLYVELGTGYTQSTLPTGDFALIDSAIHGPIGIQPRQMQGNITVYNNYYNGSPTLFSNVGIGLVTLKDAGTPDAGHTGKNTYPNDIGLLISGYTNAGSDTTGWTTGIQVGGIGSFWGESKSIVGTGIHIRDHNVVGLLIDNQNSSSAPDISITGFITGVEMTAPSAPATNSGNIFFQDNGSGKSQACVRFNSGATQCFATEP